MKKIKNIILLLSVGLFLFSCNEYLDIEPEDQVLEDQIFGNQIGIESVLNGIYIDMRQPSLYGGALTMSTVEVLGQSFDVLDEYHAYHTIGYYNYEDLASINQFGSIWSSVYTQVLNVNKFIENAEQVYLNMEKDQADILLGEAYAIRALLHFDLLRIFGPVYSLNPSAQAIPYKTSTDIEISPILNADEVLALINADLATAESLLENDPVRKFGPIGLSSSQSPDYSPEGSEEDAETYGGSDFYRFRNYRMNYYAVLGNQARVAHWSNDFQLANQKAVQIIQEAEQWFPWTQPSDVISSGNPDLLFSSELIFGLYNEQLYDRYDDYYSPSLSRTRLLTSLEGNLDINFESNQNDYRYDSTWKYPSSGTTAKTFFKYSSTGNNSAYRMQPMMRISELYLIAAETASNEADALTYLNALRYNRGLQDLGTGIDIQAEIQKEYRKEFYGEGQMFYFYKRNYVQSIQSGSDSGVDIEMSELEYVVPLPLNETEYR